MAAPKLTVMGAPRTSLERARQHKIESAGIGADIGREMIDKIRELEEYVAAATELGDYLPPVMMQAAADLERDLSAVRQRIEAVIARGAV